MVGKRKHGEGSRAASDTEGPWWTKFQGGCAVFLTISGGVFIVSGELAMFLFRTPQCKSICAHGTSSGP